MAGAEKQRENRGRPPVGRLLYVKTHVMVQCGGKSVYQTGRAHVDEGWALREDAQGVWIGAGTKGPGMPEPEMHWAFVPWDSIQFTAYAPAEVSDS